MEAIKINDFQLSTFSLLLVVQQQVRGGPAFTICGLAFHCISSLYFADQGPLGQVGLGFWKAKRFFPYRWRGKPLEMKKKWRNKFYPAMFFQFLDHYETN